MDYFLLLKMQKYQPIVTSYAKQHFLISATNKVEFLVSNTNDTETQKRTALLREFEEQVAGDVRKALMSLRQKFGDRFLLPEKNCNSETQETWTSV